MTVTLTREQIDNYCYFLKEKLLDERHAEIEALCTLALSGLDAQKRIEELEHESDLDEEEKNDLEDDNYKAHKRIKELEEALKVFADEASRYDPPEDDDYQRLWDVRLTIGDLRKAARTLNTP